MYNIQALLFLYEAFAILSSLEFFMAFNIFCVMAEDILNVLAMNKRENIFLYSKISTFIKVENRTVKWMNSQRNEWIFVYYGIYYQQTFRENGKAMHEARIFLQLRTAGERFRKFYLEKDVPMKFSVFGAFQNIRFLAKRLKALRRIYRS